MPGQYKTDTGLDVPGGGSVGSVVGSGTAGTLTFTPGPGAAGSGATVLKLYFPVPFVNAPSIVITPGNTAMNLYTAKFSAESTTTYFSLVTDTVAGGEDGVVYVIHWQARGWLAV